MLRTKLPLVISTAGNVRESLNATDVAKTSFVARVQLLNLVHIICQIWSSTVYVVKPLQRSNTADKFNRDFRAQGERDPHS